MKNRIGETNIASNGQKMTIIDYRGVRDIDIQFEDGTIVRNKDYHNHFKRGYIDNPNYTLPKKRIGETNIANNGQKMTVIAYRRSYDIDIQFEDGTIIRNREYKCFKNGHIRNPNFKKNNKIGETNIASNGQKMIIIAYRNATDIDIQFEDGTIVEHRSYVNFKFGSIRNENIAYKIKDRTGETNIAFNGQKITIIAYRKSNDIDVQFEDGTIVRDKAYGSFKSGSIKNPNFKKTRV